MMGSSWKGVRNSISQFLSELAPRRPKRRRNIRDVALRAEWLEPRRLLAANQITLDPSISAIVIEGTSGVDRTLVWSNTPDVVEVTLQSASGTIYSSFASSTVAQVQFIGGDGNDRFSNATSLPSWAWGDGGNDELIGGTGVSHLYGGSGDDQLYGNVAADFLDGQDGNDVLNGGAGDDYLFGGAGDDKLYGEDGQDQLYGQDGSDYLDGGAGNDRLWGGLGDDYLQGGVSGDDALYGEDGQDQLYGQDGNDYLDGGAGNDRLGAAWAMTICRGA